jgi:fengycin family lipopeptide synthetase B
MNLIKKFNATALEHPQEIAVCDGTSLITYIELYRQSNQIANYLLSIGLIKGKRVGILMTRSTQLPLAILGVLKAGGACVPLDPKYPAERIVYMIEASNLDILIVDRESLSLFTTALDLINGRRQFIFLIDEPFSSWKLQTEENPQIEIVPEDTILILFTSGSTGQPKGVELCYAGYINNFENMQELLGLQVGDKIAQMASQCFDISVTELWMPLLFGATVCIVSDEIKKNPWALADWINLHKIDIIQFVPSLFQNFLHALQNEEIFFPSLKKILFIGEALRSQLIKKWFEIYAQPECKAYNLYGPVEASIEVSAYVMDRNTILERDIVPIGKPFKGVEFIWKDQLTNRMQQQILYLRGVQVAKGYLNPEQTAKFFNNDEYCTGDVVEKLANGDYLFLRRRDRQIKIRGHRVELDEIENILLLCPGVSNAAVILQREKDLDKIIAYIGSEIQNELSIFSYLRKKLPFYMIPHQIVFMAQLPLNQNGKVNYKKLEHANF